MHILKEIFDSIKNHKSKSVIAGITVSWGIILLILLIGTGQGLQNGVSKLFNHYTKKTVEVYGNETTISGLLVSKGEIINFRPEDIYAVRESFPEIVSISPIIETSDIKISSLNKEIKKYSIFGVNEQFFKIKNFKITDGRSIHSIDQNEKVVVIGENIAENLFNNKTCVGQIVFLNNVGYTVIGVLSKGNLLSSADNSIFIPENLAYSMLNKRKFNNFILSLNKKTKISDFKKMLYSYLAIRKGFNKRDKQAIIIDSIEESLKAFNTLFKSINLFLWFISISFLISGMLSIFNVMTIIVKDRTGEFGIRKSVGATPKSIQTMILSEALLLTLVAGIIGLFIGYVIIEMANLYITIKDKNPFLILEIDFPIILIALLLLMITGCIAGIIPARKASKILPVEALRHLNN